MRIYLLLLAIVNLSTASGQRASVQYIPIDSISVIPTKVDVKLDFKGNTVNDGRVPTAYPWLKTAKRTGTGWTGDTVYLTIDTEIIEFIEWKGLGVDYYSFAEERLESTSYKNDQKMIIRSSEIKEFASDAILFRLTLEFNRKKTNGTWRRAYLRQRDVWIKRNELDGVLINELDLE